MWRILFNPVIIQAAPADTSGFSVKEINGISWFHTPDGKPFFSAGVCCVNTGITFDEYNPDNPGYAEWQHFKNPTQWVDDTIDSLKYWGFTTIGGWSSMEQLLQSKKMDMYFYPVLSMGMEAGAPWFDMWDSSVIKRIDEIARERILPLKNNPNLIGYYTDNEMGWWNAALWNMTFQNKPSSIARHKQIEIIYNHYSGNWNNLLKDFDPEGAKSFDELKDGGKLFLRPGGNGIRVIKKFVKIIAERYYSLCKEIIKKYDKKTLILGDRYQSFFYPEVAEASKEYVDVVSTNYNAHWNDGTFARFYLSTLHEITGKPILIGEYYLSAMENRSGNKNTSATFPTVQTQKQRADGFLNSVKSISQTPYVVGADWFQFYDEPTNGRDDGENYNMGLIDIHGKPYEELTAAAKNFNWVKSKSNPLNNLSDASSGIPPAPKNEIISKIQKEVLQNWDRQHGFVKPITKYPLADMYLCWNPDTLYIGIYGDDVVEKEFYRNQEIPEEDRMEVILDIKGNEQIKIKLGSGKLPSCTKKEIDVLNLSGVFLTVRNITVIKIPAKFFGIEKLSAGKVIKLSARLNTFARAYSVGWEVNYPLLD